MQSHLLLCVGKTLQKEHVASQEEFALHSYIAARSNYYLQGCTYLTMGYCGLVKQHGHIHLLLQGVNLESPRIWLPSHK